MTDYAALLAAAREVHLDIFGAFHPVPADGAPEGTGTLLLLGPDEPGFWPVLTGSPEWRDGARNPVDRWSRRVIGALADGMGGTALFPFEGPPWRPFIAWAQRTGRAWRSPVTLLVHDRAGLMVSYRGAIALEDRVALPATGTRPCDTCEKPCLYACPAGALGKAGYDVPSCHTYLTATPENLCLKGGCAVRRACPLSQVYGRDPAQSAYHMSQFHP